MVTPVEWLFFGVLTTLTGLLSAFIVWKIIQPGLQRFVADKERTIPAQMKKQLKSFMEEQLEDVDLSAVTARLGSGEGDLGGLGDIAGLLGSGGGGLNDLIKLFSMFGSQKGQKGGHNPGK